MASGVLLPLRSCLLSSLGPGECGPVGSDPSSLWASLSSPVKGGVWVLHQNHLESSKIQCQATHPGVLISLVAVGPSPRFKTELNDPWDSPSSTKNPQFWLSAPLLYLLN